MKRTRNFLVGLLALLCIATTATACGQSSGAASSGNASLSSEASSSTEKNDGSESSSDLGAEECSHTLNKVEAKSATCTEVGWNAYEYCENEGCEYTTYIEISALGHDTVSFEAQAPTCTEIGWEAYEACSRCSYTTYAEISALSHDISTTAAQAPSCSSVGWEEYESCSRCSYTTYTELPKANEHTFVDGVCQCGKRYSQGLKFTLSSNGEYYKVTGIGTCTDTEIVIPSTHEGLPVTVIGDSAFENCVSLTEIVILDGVTTIEDWAFSRCDSLTKIDIGDGVTTIGKRAFSHCSSLTEVVIPDGVTTIDSSAFKDNRGLTIYCEAESQPSGWNSSWNSSKAPVVWNFKNNDIASDGYMYTVIDGVRYGIKDGVATVVRQLSNIVTVNISSDITYKNNSYAVTALGDGAFKDCYRLTEIVIPDGVATIGAYVFDCCRSLTEIKVGGSSKYYQSIDGNLYSKDGKTLIQYAIGKTATDFTVLDGVTAIGDYAFSSCSSLTKIVIPNGVAEIGNYAFSICEGLTEIVVPDGVATIGGYAFSGCGCLREIVVPNSVASIGDRAFEDCDSLTGIVIGDGVTTLGRNAFYDCDSLIIYCKAEGQPSGWNLEWNDYGCPVVWDCKNNDIASDGYIYTAIDGVRYGIKDGVAAVVKQSNNIVTANILGSITYKNNSYAVTAIVSNAFAWAEALTEVVIPNGVTEIGSYAFEGCRSLTKIIIPDSVAIMGESVFMYCMDLTIYCQASEKPYNWMDGWNGSDHPNRDYPTYWYSENEPTGEGNYWHYVDGKVTVWA